MTKERLFCFNQTKLNQDWAISVRLEYINRDVIKNFFKNSIKTYKVYQLVKYFNMIATDIHRGLSLDDGSTLSGWYSIQRMENRNNNNISPLQRLMLYYSPPDADGRDGGGRIHQNLFSASFTVGRCSHPSDRRNKEQHNMDVIEWNTRRRRGEGGHS